MRRLILISIVSTCLISGSANPVRADVSCQMTGLVGAIFHAAVTSTPPDRLQSMVDGVNMDAMRAALDQQLSAGDAARVLNTIGALGRRETPPFRDLALSRRLVSGLSCTPDPTDRRAEDDDRGAALLTNAADQTIFVPSKARSTFLQDNARLIITLIVVPAIAFIVVRGIRQTLRNRRRHYRHACNVTCELNPGTSGQTGRLLDMSQMGCRILCARPLQPGRTVHIRAGPFDQTATVNWARGRNAGLTFDAPVSSLEIGQILDLTQEERRRTRIARLRALYRT